MWTLWRRYSLRTLKLELSVFIAQFAFQAVWSISHFFFHQTLLALVALLLLWCNILLATMLFWKKERLSGWLLLFPLAWIFYLVGVNMITCISNP
jgi:tryptophan-rich sensory protein